MCTLHRLVCRVDMKNIPGMKTHGPETEQLVNTGQWVAVGAYEQEHATPLYSCHGVFIDRFIFR